MRDGGKPTDHGSGTNIFIVIWKLIGGMHVNDLIELPLIRIKIIVDSSKSDI